MKKHIILIAMIVAALVHIRGWAADGPGTHITADAKELRSLLDQFKNGREFNEVALQNLLDLLGAEMDIVNLLLVGHTGVTIENAVITRSERLQHSIPSAAVLYDKVMDIATYDETLNAALNSNMKGKKDSHLVKALTCNEKKAFLYHVRNKLEHYYLVMRAMQCDISLASGRGAMVSTEGKTIGFCPIVR